MHWSYSLGTSAIDMLTENAKEFTRAASILGVFVVGSLTVICGGTNVSNFEIPNGHTQEAVEIVETISDQDLGKYETLIFGEDGEPLAGQEDASIEALPSGQHKVTYYDYSEQAVTINIQDILDGILPAAIPLMITLLYYLMAFKGWTPLKCIVLILVIGLVGSGFGVFSPIWG